MGHTGQSAVRSALPARQCRYGAPTTLPFLSPLHTGRGLLHRRPPQTARSRHTGLRIYYRRLPVFSEPIGNEQAKASSRRAEPPHRKKGKPDKKAAAPAWSAEEKRTLLSFLQGPEEDWTLAFDEDTCTALHSLHASFREVLQEKGIRLLHSGIPLAQRRGRDLIPHTALALSTALRRGRFPEAALTHEQALAYLRRDAIQLPPDIPRGFVLLTFRGIPLGFAKNIGNRCNNLYPAEWRIRTTYLPDRPQSLME